MSGNSLQGSVSFLSCDNSQSSPTERLYVQNISPCKPDILWFAMSERPSMCFNKFQKSFQKRGNLWVKRQRSSPYWGKEYDEEAIYTQFYDTKVTKKVSVKDEEKGVTDSTRYVSFIRGIFLIKFSYIDDRCEKFLSLVFFFECFYRLAFNKLTCAVSIRWWTRKTSWFPDKMMFYVFSTTVRHPRKI